MPVMPWKVNSMRILLGRAVSITSGASMPGRPCILPVMRMVLTAFSLSMPPLASMFFLMISSMLRAAGAWAEAVTATRTAAIQHARVLRFMSPPRFT